MNRALSTAVEPVGSENITAIIQAEEIQSIDHSHVILGVMCVAVIFFFMIEGLMHKYHPKVGHETGVTIIAGVIFSIIYFYAHGETLRDFELF